MNKLKGEFDALRSWAEASDEEAAEEHLSSEIEHHVKSRTYHFQVHTVAECRAHGCSILVVVYMVYWNSYAVFNDNRQLRIPLPLTKRLVVVVYVMLIIKHALACVMCHGTGGHGGRDGKLDPRAGTRTAATRRLGSRPAHRNPAEARGHEHGLAGALLCARRHRADAEVSSLSLSLSLSSSPLRLSSLCPTPPSRR